MLVWHQTADLFGPTHSNNRSMVNRSISIKQSWCFGHFILSFFPSLCLVWQWKSVHIIISVCCHSTFMLSYYCHTLVVGWAFSFIWENHCIEVAIWDVPLTISWLVSEQCRPAIGCQRATPSCHWLVPLTPTSELWPRPLDLWPCRAPLFLLSCRLPNSLMTCTKCNCFKVFSVKMKRGNTFFFCCYTGRFCFLVFGVDFDN